MMALLRREVLIPLLVIVVGGGAYVTRPWAGNEPPARMVSRQAPPPVPAAASEPVADVKLELLNPSARDASAGTRNLFQFGSQPAPATSARRASARPEFTGPPVPTGPPPPPPIALRFIGLIEAPPQTGRVALLSDGRGGLMSGREGDTIEGRYRMLRVGTDSIEMAYVDGRGRQTIRLSGQ
jgi:hypothetical protein